MTNGMPSSREKILTKIRNSKPTQKTQSLPTNIDFENSTSDWTALRLISLFTSVLKSIGGEAAIATNFDFIKQDILGRITAQRGAANIINLIPNLAIKGTDCNLIEISQIRNPHDLASIDLAIIEGKIGVAENGAIWLDENSFGGHRVLPFITQHLIIVLKQENIVANMHQAYTKIALANIGFGLFLAGPSKTADIEQSLVIGAHGARSLNVYLIK